MVPAETATSELPLRPHPDDIPPGGCPESVRRSGSSEVVRKGEEIFERDVKPTLPPDPPPHTIVIDVDGGGWEVDPDEVVAAKRFSARWPRGRGYMRRLDSAVTGHIGLRRAAATG